MKNLIAQIQIAPGEGFKGIGPLGNPTGSGIGNLASFISGVVGVMTIVAIIWALIVIITGAVSIISSGGDKQALEAAKKRITSGIIGLIVVIISIFLIEIVGYFLGITDILNIQTLFGKIGGTP